MGKHDKSTDNGQGELDISKTKDVRDATSGKHSDQDKGDENRGDDQGKQK